MGMLMAMTLLKQKQEAEAKAVETNAPEEIPFADPPEPVEEPVKKEPVKRATPAKRRRATRK